MVCPQDGHKTDKRTVEANGRGGVGSPKIFLRIYIPYILLWEVENLEQ